MLDNTRIRVSESVSRGSVAREEANQPLLTDESAGMAFGDYINGSERDSIAMEIKSNRSSNRRSNRTSTCIGTLKDDGLLTQASGYSGSIHEEYKSSMSHH